MSSAELENIQQELEERIKFVEELKKEAEIAENVISLTDEQVNAVQEKLNEELEANSNQGLIQNIIISTFFFGLGLVIQPIINLMKRKSSKENENNIEETQHEKYSDEEIEQAIKLLDTLSQSRNKSTKEE